MVPNCFKELVCSIVSHAPCSLCQLINIVTIHHCICCCYRLFIIIFMLPMNSIVNTQLMWGNIMSSLQRTCTLYFVLWLAQTSKALPVVHISCLPTTYTVAMVYMAVILYTYTCTCTTAGCIHGYKAKYAWSHTTAVQLCLGKLQGVGVHSTSHLDYGPIVVYLIVHSRLRLVV
jgi:hypothetical protein